VHRAAPHRAGAAVLYIQRVRPRRVRTGAVPLTCGVFSASSVTFTGLEPYLARRARQTPGREK
jgi:hypothetical protein